MDRVGESSADQQLSTPVQFLGGVGPDRAQLLERIGLKTAADVLFCFPRDYLESDLAESTADLITQFFPQKTRRGTLSEGET